MIGTTTNNNKQHAHGLDDNKKENYDTAKTLFLVCFFSVHVWGSYRFIWHYNSDQNWQMHNVPNPETNLYFCSDFCNVLRCWCLLLVWTNKWLPIQSNGEGYTNLMQKDWSQIGLCNTSRLNHFSTSSTNGPAQICNGRKLVVTCRPCHLEDLAGQGTPTQILYLLAWTFEQRVSIWQIQNYHWARGNSKVKTISIFWTPVLARLGFEWAFWVGCKL